MNRTFQLIIAVLAIFCASFIADDVIGSLLFASFYDYFRAYLFDGAGALDINVLLAVHHAHEMIVWTIQAGIVVVGFRLARRFNLYGAGELRAYTCPHE